MIWQSLFCAIADGLAKAVRGCLFTTGLKAGANEMGTLR